ncbi:uncharacterized protein L969DRAFT_94625 [Mixia osmundae IAM 14324]|uniref:Formate dehydrogenase n=1 Tax=Mixia osmundae (strain CBS 9802 / IAM 14324 / JCM 22182 / KY 12970) TaxID=764103 RepID=G7DVY8_MIXOS|nr:uncharacterized protein L969DRAFT_94625 [Mixia osmundae IAM 14324]KEI39570.1 hypothetical protein L969DRAFT_94625 [Mixia osmundae IAM 14324]GAA94748.1 hypothetical protein E5Q_01402 [Mixia osmundae IAM 14324]
MSLRILEKRSPTQPSTSEGSSNDMNGTALRAQKVLAVLYSGGKYGARNPRMLGTTEQALGLGDYLKSKGHTLVVTDDKEGADSTFQKEIVDADILITTPFHPGYATRDVISKAKNLKLCITAGVGSDHIDLNAANERKITVAEVSGSNVVSVAEHVVMTMLCLVRNFVPAHEQIRAGDWNVAKVAQDAYDIEGKVIGTIGAGRIGQRVLRRLQPFDPKQLYYYDYTELPNEIAKDIKVERITDLKEFLGKLDILTINCPLHEQTKGMINKETIGWMKKGSWIVNTARGAICDADAIAEAVNSGHLLGYGGDVWPVQPAPANMPWRTMAHPNSEGDKFNVGSAMTPHYSGTTLDAQKRYADGTKTILENYLNHKPQDPQNLICEGGDYATKAYGAGKRA